MASYLEPRPTDEEIVEAIQYHFPISMHRAMLSTQLRSVGEALDLLKCIEILEVNEGGNRLTNSPFTQGPHTNRLNPNSHGNDRSRPQLRNVQYYPHSRNNHYRNPRRNWNDRERDNEPRSVGSPNLNPNAQPFNASQENSGEGQQRVNNNAHLGN
jgi:hypothetical protein